MIQALGISAVGRVHIETVGLPVVLFGIGTDDNRINEYPWHNHAFAVEGTGPDFILCLGQHLSAEFFACHDGGEHFQLHGLLVCGQIAVFIHIGSPDDAVIQRDGL